MKPERTLLLLLFFFAITVASAQSTTPAFTDEDLKKYALTMDSVDAMKANLTKIVTEMVQTNTVMTVPRYNELFKIADDTAKLAEAKATAEEIAFVKKVEARREEEIQKMNATYQSLARDYVGAKQFNAIRKSLQEDAEVKAKYESISKELDSKSGE